MSHKRKGGLEPDDWRMTGHAVSGMVKGWKNGYPIWVERKEEPKTAGTDLTDWMYTGRKGYEEFQKALRSLVDGSKI